MEVAAGRLPQQVDEDGFVESRDLSDGAEASAVELRCRDAADSPEPLHRERVQEAELVVGCTTSRPLGFATALATFARNFVRATPTVMGRPTSSWIRRWSRTAISVGGPASRSNPRTSRNASSIERPSTSGVVSSNTSNTALLASEYADIRGGTTTACGHSRRACRPPMAVWMPYAFAS